MYQIRREGAAEAVAREALLDRAFGPNRHLKTSARLRAGRLPADGLSLVAEDVASGRLLATVRLWTMALGNGIDGDARPALLLGPLAVDPQAQGRGIGARLMRFSLAEAACRGHGSVILVGDPEYYARFGFEARLVADLALPGPVETRRFQGFELIPGALQGAAGLVRPTGAMAPVVPSRAEPALALAG
ncbi:MAG: N-acetyltransferase [Ancalomicrobiaceae bacterium]|nr:N-acetyltransferase [Ancalomicrobiaceae bacterium]